MKFTIKILIFFFFIIVFKNKFLKTIIRSILIYLRKEKKLNIRF